MLTLVDSSGNMYLKNNPFNVLCSIKKYLNFDLLKFKIRMKKSVIGKIILKIF